MGTMALSGCCLSTRMLTTKEKNDGGEGKNTDYSGCFSGTTWSYHPQQMDDDNLGYPTHTESACGPADWHSWKDVLTPLHEHRFFSMSKKLVILFERKKSNLSPILLEK